MPFYLFKKRNFAPGVSILINMDVLQAKRAYEKGRKVLENAGYTASPGLDALILLCGAAGISKERFYAHNHEIELTPRQLERYYDFIRLRLARVPVAYITKKKEFMGLDFYVDRRVLIPRPSTETLVENALDFLKTATVAKPIILDIGTGSGNVAVSLAYHNPGAVVYSVDSSLKALDVARKNTDEISKKRPEKNILPRIHLVHGDMFEAFPSALIGSVSLVISNPPYVTPEEWNELMDGVRLFEPKDALVYKKGAEKMYEIIASEAMIYLRWGGSLMSEIGSKQGVMVKKTYERAGFLDVETVKDVEGHDRVVMGIK